MVDSQAYELNIFKNNQLFKSEFPYNTSKDIARYGRYLDNPAGFTRSQTDTIVYFTRPLNYSIYEVSPSSVTWRRLQRTSAISPLIKISHD